MEVLIRKKASFEGDRLKKGIFISQGSNRE